MYFYFPPLQGSFRIAASDAALGGVLTIEE